MFGLLGLGVFLVTLFIVIRIKVGGLRALGVKVLAGMCYILLSISILGEVNYPVLGFYIVAGQIFGILGDVFLDQKYIHPEHAEGYTHFGFTVFGLGHLFFITGLLKTYSFNTVHILIAVVGALIIGGFVAITEKPFKLNYGRIRIDVVVYSLIIGFMTVLPCVWLVASGSKTALIIFIAMIAFLLSDLILSQIYFGKDNNKPGFIALNYVFYYAAQFGISLSLLFIMK